METALYSFNCRPHWGKIHFLTKDKIKKLYGTNYDRFAAVRAKLDPDRMFSNPFIDDLFD
jgi:FAD/FMN-containing dehydrogenase